MIAEICKKYLDFFSNNTHIFLDIILKLTINEFSLFVIEIIVWKELICIL